MRNRIIPAILPLLREIHPDLVDSSVLAVARMLEASNAGDVLEPIAQTVGHSARTGRQAATLALGVLGSEEAVEILRDLMLDTQRGRQLSGHPAGVEDLVRAFAAASLGMIGNVEIIPDLKNVVTSEALHSKRDLKAMAILALGMMPQEHEDIVPFLIGLMMDRRLDRLARAQAPIALGKLNELGAGGSREAVSVLGKVVQLLRDDKADHHLRRSLAVCVGMLATMADDEALDTLRSIVAKGNDDQTRQFSIMALAQIGARDETPQLNAAAHRELERFLMQELVKPRRITHQPYGALGLAVYARNPKLPDTRSRAAAKILEMFGRTNNPAYQGAMAVGLGLLSYRQARSALWDEFESSHDAPLQGYIALSLGLMRATDFAESFRSLIQKKGLEFKFRLQLARALGLMGDLQAVTTLVDYLKSAGTLSETSSSAQALGLIGDQSSVPHLLKIVQNRSAQPTTRGFACVALGIIAEKDELPWNWRFSVNSNYRAKVPALAEIFDIL